MTSLSDLAMWESWQTRVRDGLPLFATTPLYVEQDNVDQDELEAIAATLTPDPIGQMRDAQYGARVFQTLALGPTTRMWVDSCVEIDFLQRHLASELAQCDVVDIGAGYGRLAVMLAHLVKSYTCVDPVDISRDLCSEYCAWHAKVPVSVMTPEAWLHDPGTPNLAINIHSWNECTLAQIERWLDALVSLKTRWLFTVQHNATYFAWDEGHPSYRPLLEARYRLVVEERIGLCQTPHALWELR